MNHRSALLSLSLLSSLCACGPGSVRPVEDGASGADASPDSASPSLCAAPIAVLDAPATEVERVAFDRAGDAFVMVTSSASGALRAQAFDARWQRAGSPIALPPAPSTTGYTVDEPSVHFDGARGAIAYGTTVHEVAIDGALQLAAVRAMQTEGASASVLGAWPRTDDVGQQRLTAVSDEASVWNASLAGLTRSFAASMGTDWIQATVLLHPVEDRFVAYERIARRDINNDLRVRQFIVGHGAVLPSSERIESGTLIGDPVALGDRVVRLHYRVGGPSGEDSFALVQDRREDGVEQSRVAITERARVSDGRIAPRPGSDRVEDALLVWSRMDVDSPAQTQIVAQRGPTSAPSIVHETALGIVVHGAWLDPDGARGWIVYGEYEQSASPRRRLFARCVER